MKTTSKTERVLSALQKGQRLTAAKIRATYKVASPGALIYNLRERGIDVQTTGQGGKGNKGYYDL